MANANGTGALSHLVVLDLATASAQSVGKVLAGLGATVVKIEPPEGDASRSMSPFAGDLAGPESSLYFAHYNTGKRSVVIDLESRGGRRQVRDLAARSDVLIESFEPGYLENIGLGYKRLARLNPGLVMTSVTTFGHTGPYHGYRGSELVAQAMGGLMYIQGDDQREPCMAPCDQAFQLASFHALYGTLAALHRRRGTGRGGHVDVSAQEATASVMFTLARYAALGEIPRRTGAMPPTAPSNYYQCADGYLCLSVVTDGHWKTFVEWTGDERLASSDFAKRHQRVKRVEEIDRIAADFVRPFTVEEFVEEGQRRHLCVSALNTVGSLTRSPHPKSRGFFAEVDHPRLGQHRYSGSPFRLSDTPSITRAAPALGQHAGWESPVLDRPSSPGPASPGRSQKEAPLAGVRIADFTRVWAGPMATRYLGDLGAEVIKIESGRFLDFGRDGGPASHIFCELNRSKLGITLNFQDERGRRLAEELVSVSDVVVDNFAAGVLERRGLGYETLKKIRPDVIVVNMPGYGISGPFSGYISYGQNLMGLQRHVPPVGASRLRV